MRKYERRSPVTDVGPFWPAGWPVVPMVSGPGWHQIRLHGQSGRALIDVKCCCGAYCGSFDPARQYMKCRELFAAHIQEVADAGQG